jgi:hypothetical protein
VFDEVLVGSIRRKGCTFVFSDDVVSARSRCDYIRKLLELIVLRVFRILLSRRGLHCQIFLGIRYSRNAL